MNRRELLKATAAAAAATAVAAIPTAGAKALSTNAEHKKYRKIDAFSHIAFPKLLDYLESKSKREHVFRKLFSNTPTLVNPSKRIELMDRHEIQASVLVPLPWLETVPEVHSDPAFARIASRLCNDALARLCQSYPERFYGVAVLPTTNEEVMLEEFDRAVKELGLAGVYIVTGPTVKRPDHPDFRQLYKAAAGMDVPVWIHPSRPKNFPDYPDEAVSKFQIWQGFSWLLDSTAAMVRIVFDGVFDRHPNLKIVIHHHGALIPLFADRLIEGINYFEMASGEKIETQIEKPYIRHFKKFYCDTAAQGYNQRLIQSAYDFFGSQRLLFGTDAPMDSTAGETFISGAVKSVEALAVSDEHKKQIFHNNITGLLRLKRQSLKIRDGSGNGL